MQRAVTAELDLDLTSRVELIFQITAARTVPVAAERLEFVQGERLYPAEELVDGAGSRSHRVIADPGPLHVRYAAAVAEPVVTPDTTTRLDLIAALRPSRYCQSDEVFAQAQRQFGGLERHEQIEAVSSFVATSVTYSPGLSLGTDSAVTTLATGRGVCRDYAHLVIALLRALDVPARYVACYAPELEPMDFHAVAEAWVGDAWHVIDATRLAPRGALVRIATGRDAADCAFLTYHGGHVGLDRLEVHAGLEGGTRVLPPDDHRAPVRIS